MGVVGGEDEAYSAPAPTQKATCFHYHRSLHRRSTHWHLTSRRRRHPSGRAPTTQHAPPRRARTCRERGRTKAAIGDKHQPDSDSYRASVGCHRTVCGRGPDEQKSSARYAVVSKLKVQGKERMHRPGRPGTQKARSAPPGRALPSGEAHPQRR